MTTGGRGSNDRLSRIAIPINLFRGGAGFSKSAWREWSFLLGTYRSESCSG